MPKMPISKKSPLKKKIRKAPSLKQIREEVEKNTPKKRKAVRTNKIHTKSQIAKGEATRQAG